MSLRLALVLSLFLPVLASAQKASWNIYTSSYKVDSAGLDVRAVEPWKPVSFDDVSADFIAKGPFEGTAALVTHAVTLERGEKSGPKPAVGAAHLEDLAKKLLPKGMKVASTSTPKRDYASALWTLQEWEPATGKPAAARLVLLFNNGEGTLREHIHVFDVQVAIGKGATKPNAARAKTLAQEMIEGATLKKPLSLVDVAPLPPVPLGWRDRGPGSFVEVKVTTTTPQGTQQIVRRQEVTARTEAELFFATQDRQTVPSPAEGPRQTGTLSMLRSAKEVPKPGAPPDIGQAAKTGSGKETLTLANGKRVACDWISYTEQGVASKDWYSTEVPGELVKRDVDAGTRGKETTEVIDFAAKPWIPPPPPMALEQRLAMWDGWAETERLAMRCPIVEPWKIAFVSAALKVVEEERAPAKVDFPARRKAAHARADGVACSDLKSPLRVAMQERVVTAMVEAGGWYALRTTPCPTANTPEPKRLLAELEPMEKTYPKSVKAPMDVLRNGGTKRLDDLCESFQIADRRRKDALFEMKLHQDEGKQGQRVLRMRLPTFLDLSVPGTVEARRGYITETSKEDRAWAVHYRASDLGIADVHAGFLTDGSFAIEITPDSRGKFQVFGAEVRLFATGAATATATFAPLREVKPIVASDYTAPPRLFVFGPDLSKAIADAPEGTTVAVLADLQETGKTREVKEWNDPKGSAFPARHPADRLRLARSWALSEGSIGFPLKPVPLEPVP